ncbi:MAG: PQQ-binding-like beta-propeller repeat protein [Steroidobacteraceae bacterium]
MSGKCESPAAMVRNVYILGWSLLICSLAGCQRAQRPPPSLLDDPAAVTVERLLAAPGDGAQWITHGGAYSEQRFSHLRQIDVRNVGQLRLAWQADYGSSVGQQGVPLYIDGVIYVPVDGSRLLALDARDGRQLWQYDAGPAGSAVSDPAARGLAAYRGRIIMSTAARLIAIDARTGREAWSQALAGGAEPSQGVPAATPPRIVQGKVLIGATNAGARGALTAFDADMGREIWRFHNVPGDPALGFGNEAMKRAATTWSGEWWTTGGGGGVGEGAVYDPATDLFIYGTGGSALPHDARSGDRLFTASLIALKAGSGEYVWHYQTTPAGSGQYDATDPMMTLDVLIDGKPRHVLVQPNANGFLYMLDVATGELLAADAFTTVDWATGVDMKTGRPDVARAARSGKARESTLPAPRWYSAAYSPDTGLMYIADADHVKAWNPVARMPQWETGSLAGSLPGGVLATAGGLVFHSAGGQLRGVDAKTGRQLWSHETQSVTRAPPISYELDGRQYIAVSTGGAVREDSGAGASARLLVFALGSDSAQLGEQQH